MVGESLSVVYAQSAVANGSLSIATRNLVLDEAANAAEKNGPNPAKGYNCIWVRSGRKLACIRFLVPNNVFPLVGQPVHNSAVTI